MRDTRINELHRRLASHRRVTAKGLADEFHVDVKTIRRDVDWMRRKGYPIRNDRREGTLYYDGTAVELSAAIISTEDRFGILIARQAAKQFQGTPWHDKLVSTYTRMLDTLHRELRTDFESIASKIRFEGMPQPPVNKKTWEILTDCLEAGETVEMMYRSGDGGRCQKRRLDPYGLIVRNREWFVVGWDHLRKAIRTFFLPRIQSLESVDKRFAARDGFDLDAYLETAVDAQQSSRTPIEVKLRFSLDASPAGEDFIWNRNQKISRDAEGRLLVEFATGALFAVERHVLSWGGGVEVLSPPELRKSVRIAAQAIVRLAGRASL